MPPTYHAARPPLPQANNAYIFPAVGHAAVLARCPQISDDVFLVAAEALAGMTTAAELDQGFLFPRFSGIQAVSARLMAAVADFMVRCAWVRGWVGACTRVGAWLDRQRCSGGCAARAVCTCRRTVPPRLPAHSLPRAGALRPGQPARRL